MREPVLPFIPGKVQSPTAALKLIGFDFGEPTKLLQGFGRSDFARLPSVAIAAATSASERNLEAVVATNRALTDAGREIGQRQVDLVRDCVTDLAQTVKDVLAADGAEARVQRQIDFTKRAMANAARHVRASSEITSRSQRRVLDAVGHRVAGAFDGLKDASKEIVSGRHKRV